MKIDAIKRLIELSGAQWPNIAKKAASEAKRVEVAQETLREMFDEGNLDPHPTSDAANEIVLRKFCGWKDSDGVR